MDRSRMVDVGDVQLFLREIGPEQPPSPPLVAIHGGPSWDHGYLLPGILPVADARRVILFDIRGCGRSSRDLGPAAYQPEYVVDDLARLIGVLGHEQVDLLGFSTGGQVAQLVAEAHGHVIRRLVLASTTAYATSPTDLAGWKDYQRRLAEVPALEDGLDDLETTIQWAIDRASISIWKLERLDDYLALLKDVRFSGDWLEPLRTGRLHPWRPNDPAGILRSLGQPILILHGRQDMIFPVHLAQRLHAAVPNSELKIIDRAGHMAQFNQPERWSRAVVEFLSV